MTMRRIRRAVRQGRYQFSGHSLEEMDEDDLSEADVRRVVLGGDIVTELTDDPEAFATSCAVPSRSRSAMLRLCAASCPKACCV
jgi:hypothetical protein